MEVLIQRSHPSDLQFKTQLQWLTDAYYAAVTEESAHSPLTSHRQMDPARRSQVEKMLVEVASQTEVAYIALAYQQEAPVGYFIGVLKYCAGENPQYIGYINGLYIIPAARGQGIAGKLLDAGYAWFEAQGARHVELYTNLDNELGAKFWRKRGYAPVEQVLFKAL